MSIPSTSTNLQLDTKRHSFAHLMACAVQIYFKELAIAENAKNQKSGNSSATVSTQVQFGVGPVIENGCYYDFILPRPLVPEDLPKIEKVIRKLLKQDLSFKRQEVSLAEAMEIFKQANQPLKVELLENLRDKGTTSLSEEERVDLGVDVKMESPSYKEGAQRAGGVLPYNPELTEKAKELRNNSSKAEIRFWCELKEQPDLSKIDFHRQKPILEYIVDFYVQDYNLVIELDGDSHNNQMDYDQKRTQDLENLGLKVLRYTNEDVKNNLEVIFSDILEYIKTVNISIKQNNDTPRDSVAPLLRGDLIPTITLYRLVNNKTGEILFEDLCKGPHVETIEEFGELGFSLDKFSASYWRGDQERDIRMQRVYALVFETELELTTFQTQREEAKKRDHRTLNTQLKFFTISELVGAGLALFQPKGNLVRKIIQNYLWQLHKSKGYQEVWTPHMAKEELYQTSGHAKHYLDDMFSVYGGTSKENFYLKPMNCPHHMQLFADNQFSYRDMPIRYFEHATVYRDEKTGQLSGLTRVRNITQDDGHLFCRLNQLGQEIDTIVDVIKEFMATFEMKPKWVSLSVRDDKDGWLGTDEMWETAQKALQEAAIKHEIPYKVVEGEAAFYGPKLDFMFEDCIGRQQQLSTIQIDFNLPERFDLSFTNETGEKERPVVVHRAIAGSSERFMGVLIEHFAGRFPFWLAPTQVKILTINNSPEVLEYVEKIKTILSETLLMKPLKYNELRFEVDERQESLGKKIREGEMAKIPVLIIVGPKDILENQVSVRTQSGEEKVKLEELEEFLKIVS